MAPRGSLHPAAARTRWREDRQFIPPPLRGGIPVALGRWIDDADLLVFNEPDRANLPHGLGRLMHPWINHVTRHDMHVSITAGFAAGEIQRLLGLDPARWRF